MKNNKKRGFTIVELVIVIAVIAILAAVLIPTFSNVIQKANNSKALQAVRNAWTAELAEKKADEIDKFVNTTAVVEVDNIKVKYTHTDGFVVLNSEATDTVTHTLTDGKLVAKTTAPEGSSDSATQT